MQVYRCCYKNISLEIRIYNHIHNDNNHRVVYTYEYWSCDVRGFSHDLQCEGSAVSINVQPPSHFNRRVNADSMYLWISMEVQGYL